MSGLLQQGAIRPGWSSTGNPARRYINSFHGTEKGLYVQGTALLQKMHRHGLMLGDAVSWRD